MIMLSALWSHTTASSTTPRLYVYVLIGSFVFTTILETAQILYRNFALGQSSSRISLARRDASVQVSLSIPRPWNVKAGQYVNIWVPSIALWQSHPYTIVSWSLTTITFLVEPRGRFSRALLSGTLGREQGKGFQTIRRAFFTGPHGSVTSMNSYGSVLMFADGYGIAAHLPYVKELIRGYNECKAMTRRIHLVWQLKDRGERSFKQAAVYS